MLARYKNSYLSYFLMYLFWYLAWALSAQFISVYLLGQGFSATETSIVVTAAFVASMVAQPFIGGAGDRYDIKRVNYVLFGLTIVGAVAFVFAQGLIPVLLAYSLLMALLNGANPVMERVATASPFEYGRIRIWGTIGYAAGTYLAGWLYEAVSPQAIYVALVVAMLLTIVGLYGTQPQFKEATVVEVGGEPQEPVSARDLFANHRFLVYLLFMGLYAGACASPNTYFPAFLTGGGMDTTLVSTILSVAVVCEMPIVLLSGRFMDRIPNKTLLVVAFTAVLAQLASYGLMLPAPVQIALTLVGKHPAGMLLIMTNLKVTHTIVDARQQTTAQALVKTAQNLATIGLNAVSGPVLDAAGYQAMFLVNLAVMGVAFALMLAFRVESGNDSGLFA